MTYERILFLGITGSFLFVALLALGLAVYMIFTTPRLPKATPPPARTYDADLMQRQIAKLQRVASQTDAPRVTVCTGCTGQCKQGRNCTCMPEGRGAKP